jgi:hypothetical protein
MGRIGLLVLLDLAAATSIVTFGIAFGAARESGSLSGYLAQGRYLFPGLGRNFLRRKLLIRDQRD